MRFEELEIGKDISGNEMGAAVRVVEQLRQAGYCDQVSVIGPRQVGERVNKSALLSSLEGFHPDVVKEWFDKINSMVAQMDLDASKIPMVRYSLPVDTPNEVLHALKPTSYPGTELNLMVRELPSGVEARVTDDETGLVVNILDTKTVAGMRQEKKLK